MKITTVLRRDLFARTIVVECPNCGGPLALRPFVIINLEEGIDNAEAEEPPACHGRVANWVFAILQVRPGRRPSTRRRAATLAVGLKRPGCAPAIALPRSRVSRVES
jgi:hypothetical protein